MTLNRRPLRSLISAIEAHRARPHLRNRRSAPISERFWSKVQKGHGCWIWRGSSNNKGYGMFAAVKQYPLLAHRVAWELSFGPIPEGSCVLHSCDTRLCVRPDHLWLGSQTENLADMRGKGRGFTDFHRRGTEHPMSRLTDDAVVSIVSMRRDGKTLSEVAARFGIVKGTVSHIMSGNTWSWLTGIQKVRTRYDLEATTTQAMDADH